MNGSDSPATNHSLCNTSSAELHPWDACVIILSTSGYPPAPPRPPRQRVLCRVLQLQSQDTASGVCETKLVKLGTHLFNHKEQLLANSVIARDALDRLSELSVFGL